MYQPDFNYGGKRKSPLFNVKRHNFFQLKFFAKDISLNFFLILLINSILLIICPCNKSLIIYLFFSDWTGRRLITDCLYSNLITEANPQIKQEWIIIIFTLSWKEKKIMNNRDQIISVILSSKPKSNKCYLTNFNIVKENF